MIYVDNHPVNVTKFPDKTSQVWKLDPALLTQGRVIVRWYFESEDEFMHLAQLKDLLDSNEVMATLHMSYLPYGRQDKEVSNDTTFGLRSFARLLNALEFDQVEAFDPHSGVAENVIRHFKVWTPYTEIMTTWRTLGGPLVCYPDKGAATKYAALLAFNFVYADKVRDQATGEIIGLKLMGNVTGKNILICDDICDGGATFVRLANIMKDLGALEINLYVSHGLFTKGTQILRDAGINRIFTKQGELNV